MPTRHDHWAYVPPPDQRAPERHKLSVRRNGRLWSAHWELQDGKLYVCSAYGSRTEPIGRQKNLEARAEALFSEILDQGS
jgi:hypothetical protein